MFKNLEVNVQGRVAELWLNRPQKLNALSPALLQELIDAADWLNAQAEVRVVIIGGRGTTFSAGADLSAFPAVGETTARDVADLGRAMADALENMNTLSIARIDGWCVGGGLVLAAACDLRIASSSAMFSIPEVDLGIPLAWGGIPRLVREIGPALTKELVITCRPFDAEEALGAGFLNRVVERGELDQVVTELAEACASKPRIPVAATKRHVNAVTAQMVGVGNAWSDADGLIAATTDKECAAAREAYIAERRKQ